MRQPSVYLPRDGLDTMSTHRVNVLRSSSNLSVIQTRAQAVGPHSACSLVVCKTRFPARGFQPVTSGLPDLPSSRKFT